MKKEIFSLAWSEIKGYWPYAILVVLVVFYMFRSIDLNKKSIGHESDAAKYEAVANEYKKLSEDQGAVIEKYKTELEIVDSERDSLSLIVDGFEPEIVNIIEYITSESTLPKDVDSAKTVLISNIRLISLERKALVNAVVKRDEIIAAQDAQIALLNKRIVLLVSANESLTDSNLALKKQVRKEVRKRRLTTVAGIAAGVAIIIIAQ